MTNIPKLGLPELIDPRHRRWKIHSAELRDAGVDNLNAEAWVPPAYSYAQQLARLHEWKHVQVSPTDWIDEVANACRIAKNNGENIDPGVVLVIIKMVEENRVDWLLWRKHGIDVRPAREALDWSGMPDVKTPLDGLVWVLQLAWTVWASRGLGKIKHAPPMRDPDQDTAEYFDKAWSKILEHEKGHELATAVVRGCQAIYQEPSPNRRDQVAAELANFFKPKPRVEPDEKPEELEEQHEAKKQEQNKVEAQEREKEEAESGDVEHTIVQEGIIQIHDHTKGFRRSAIKIARKDTPYDRGIVMRFPHRYLTDGHVFGRRTVNEAGILVDISGSMAWTDESLRSLMALMPAVSIGVYGGFRSNLLRWQMPPDNIYGRICILAHRGRFTTYKGNDIGFMGSNEIDAEALEWLARWPEPRFWLSDGLVGAGPHQGKHPVYSSEYLDRWGLVVSRCERLMLQHRILRVPDMKTMIALLKKQAVTLYRSPVNWTTIPAHLGPNLNGMPPAYTAEQKLERRRMFYPDSMRELPARFQL